MNNTKRILATVISLLMIVFTLIAGRENTLEEVVAETTDNDSLIVWYTDDTLTDYLNKMAVEYHENMGVRVIPKLQPGQDYVESIYHASINEESAPDLYIIGSDVLEKATLSGCAVPIKDDRGIVCTDNFPEASIRAVTYHDNIVGYPLYFETTALIYNRTYLREMVTNMMIAEKAVAEDGTEDNVSSESEELASLDASEVEIRTEGCVPATFDELLTFADSYDAPAGVETFFKWDVRDIFYNYFFVGDYIDIGGANGDDANIIDINNLDAIKALKVFQDMNQFFSFESADVTYKQVVQEFLEGKLIFATATTEIINTLNSAVESGEFEYEYGIAMIPDINEDMLSRSLSVTTALAINGYSDKKDVANAFAQYLTVSHADNMYEATGKLPARSGVIDEDDPAYSFIEEYSYSSPMPKLMATSNCWLLMEGTFADVWSGADVSQCLKELSEQIKLQVLGEEVTEEYIELPKEETEEVEYLDEEALKEAAQNEGDGN